MLPPPAPPHWRCWPRATTPLIAAASARAARRGLLTSIRAAVADLMRTAGPAARLKNSDYLSRRLSHDYTYLANLFSEATGGTIEQYIIEVRIGWVKELIVAGEFNLTQISY